MTPETLRPAIFNIDDIWILPEEGLSRVIHIEADPNTGSDIIWFEPIYMSYLGVSVDPKTRPFGFRESKLRELLPNMILFSKYTPDGINTIHPN